MNNQLHLPATQAHHFAPTIPYQSTIVRSLKEEILPFTVKIVRSKQDLAKALQIRQTAYARHLPTFAETLHTAEPIDNAEGVVILVAESKLDGTAIGTMRIQTNQSSPLCLEQSVTLPDWLATRTLAEASRLGVIAGRDSHLVKSALFKGFFHYCLQNKIDWMLVTGRRPIDREYEQMTFEDIHSKQEFIPLRHVGGIPHRVMSLEVQAAEARWTKAMHPLFNFVFSTCHPDINVSMSPFAQIQ